MCLYWNVFLMESKMNTGFQKRIYTFKSLVVDMGFLAASMPRAAAMSRNEKISKAFIEKVMTVVTVINGCMYCSWFHARQAVESGLTANEVHNLFNLQFETDASEFELPALLYAQHYAETNRQPQPEMTEKLRVFYGEETASQILLIIRMITFGNLSGNTWDAIVSRLRGNPAKNSSVLFEAFFFLLTWYAMIPMMMLSRDYRQKRQVVAKGGK